MSSRAALLPVVAAALWLPTTACAGAANSACDHAYKADYAALWDIAEKDWGADCARGLGAAEVLRSRQHAFIRACAARFEGAVKGGKAHPATVSAYCAQGADGRRRLAEQVGQPEAPSAAPAPVMRGVEWRPETDGMGPMAAAIHKARAEWGSTACLTGLSHAVDIAEVCRGEQCSPEIVEAYIYYFALDDPKTRERVGGQIVYEDALKDNSCFFHQALVPKYPMIGQQAWSAGHPTGACLQNVEIDLARLMRIAEKNGLAVRGKSRAVLASGRYYPHLLKKPLTRVCEFTDRQLRRVRDKGAWLIWAAGKAYVIDAASGAVLFPIELDELCIPAEATSRVRAGCFQE